MPSHDLRAIKRIGARRQLIRWMKTSPRFTSITDLNTCLEAAAYLLAFSSKAAIFHRDHAVDAMLKKEKRIERNTPFDPLHSHGAPGRIRTVDTRFRRAVLYPLSYGGIAMVARLEHARRKTRQRIQKRAWDILAVFAEQ